MKLQDLSPRHQQQATFQLTGKPPLGRTSNFRVQCRQHTPGEMNKAERIYAIWLDSEKAAGRVIAWAFEPVKFKLAKNTSYTPDFMVVTSEMGLEFHEVKAKWRREAKGHWEDDARVKIKVAADLFPWFTFKGVWNDQGRWESEEFYPC